MTNKIQKLRTLVEALEEWKEDTNPPEPVANWAWVAGIALDALPALREAIQTLESREAGQGYADLSNPLSAYVADIYKHNTGDDMPLDNVNLLLTIIRQAYEVRQR